jgi:hypothetical protein
MIWQDLHPKDHRGQTSPGSHLEARQQLPTCQLGASSVVDCKRKGQGRPALSVGGSSGQTARQTYSGGGVGTPLGGRAVGDVARWYGVRSRALGAARHSRPQRCHPNAGAADRGAGAGSEEALGEEDLAVIYCETPSFAKDFGGQGRLNPNCARERETKSSQDRSVGERERLAGGRRKPKQPVEESAPPPSSFGPPSAPES